MSQMKRYFDAFRETREGACSLDEYGFESNNLNLIYEAGLSRLISKSEGHDWAIISAYRGEFDKKQNINRNRALRSEFNKRKMGAYQLVGHWQECQLTGVDYKDCPKESLKDVIERSYMVMRPTVMAPGPFKALILHLTKRFKQDASLIRMGGGPVSVLEKTGNSFPIGTKMTLGKVAQAYSQHVRKMNVPFVFEGVEVPASISGRLVFKEYGIIYPRVEEPRGASLKTWENL